MSDNDIIFNNIVDEKIIQNLAKLVYYEDIVFNLYLYLKKKYGSFLFK